MIIITMLECYNVTINKYKYLIEQRDNYNIVIFKYCNDNNYYNAQCYNIYIILWFNNYSLIILITIILIIITMLEECYDVTIYT